MLEDVVNVESLASIRIDRDELVKVLGRLRSIVDKKSTIPILSNVFIETIDHGTIAVSATDMDIMSKEIINAEVISNGRLTLPAHIFHDTVKALDSDVVEIIQQGTSASGALTTKVVAGRYKASLPTIAADNFPVIGMEDSEIVSEINISTENLKKLLKNTIFAATQQEMRYYLNGVYLYNASVGNAIVAASTDMHRLAEYRVFIEEPINEMPAIIMPRKTVYEVLNYIEKLNSMIKIKISKRRISFEFNSANIISKLIDAKYPDYTSVIPSSTRYQICVKASDLKRAINIISITANHHTKSIRFIFSDNIMKLTSSSEINAVSEEDIEIEYQSERPDENLSMILNYIYVNDVLSVLGGDKVVISFTDYDKAVLFADNKDASGRYVVMPTLEY